VREETFQVYGRKIAALSSGEPGQTPVLALHGWLDNAESFRALSGHLDKVHLVAPDLAGNGRSDHRSADGEYNIWSDLPDIEVLLDQLGWDRCQLLGHSRGALIASLYAGARPERVSRLMLLDAHSPQAVPAAECPDQLRAYIRDKQRYLDKPGRVFTSEDAAIQLRCTGLGEEAATLIVRRSLMAVEGGWCWSFDARLQGASAFKLTEEHNTAIMSALSMPTLILLAEDGLGAHYNSEVAANPGIRIEFVPGGHHCHMEESAELVAGYLQSFMTGEQPE
jgi:pimeloyl-ACP methyl ester carboxylesterase